MAAALAREGAHGRRRVLHAADATGRELGRALWERWPTRACASSKRARHRADHRGRPLRRRRVLHRRPASQRGRMPARCCWRLAAPARSSATPPIRRSRPATASRSRGAPARASRTWSSCSSIRPRSTCRARRASCCPRPCAARARGCSMRPASASCRATIRPAISRRATCVARDRARAAPHRPAGVPLDGAPRSGFVRARFPTVAEACHAAGLDLARDRIPVGPAAHYVMGGVETDLWGRTSVPGLFAAGEVACTGVHGANRLASNSLLEGLVFGARAAAGDGAAAARGDLAGRHWESGTSRRRPRCPASSRHRGRHARADVGPVGLLREGALAGPADRRVRRMVSALSDDRGRVAAPGHGRTPDGPAALRRTSPAADTPDRLSSQRRRTLSDHLGAKH